MGLQVSGVVSLGLFGFVVGTESFTITQATTDVDTGTGTTLADLTGASVLAVSLSNLNLFAGVGGSLDTGALANDVVSYTHLTLPTNSLV